MSSPQIVGLHDLTEASMNRFLASTLSTLNGLIAAVIVLVAAGAGRASFGGDVVGLIIGGLIGIAVAGLACGTIAFLALIEGHLRVIAGGRETTRAEPHRPGERIDPAL